MLTNSPSSTLSCEGSSALQSRATRSIFLRGGNIPTGALSASARPSVVSAAAVPPLPPPTTAASAAAGAALATLALVTLAGTVLSSKAAVAATPSSTFGTAAGVDDNGSKESSPTTVLSTIGAVLTGAGGSALGKSALGGGGGGGGLASGFGVPAGLSEPLTVAGAVIVVTLGAMGNVLPAATAAYPAATWLLPLLPPPWLVLSLAPGAP
mmetsp:Transcript_90730/g.156897  ORF Transcript_90730/g.156897 Transcript_90730/m.156897 type:complete len:210 (-) Transcript_90730:197-826(-)